MRRFELVDGKSSKFWEVEAKGKDLTVRFGKIGTNGQTQVKAFATVEKAKAEQDKLVREKTGKGYSEVRGDEPEKKAMSDESSAALSGEEPAPPTAARRSAPKPPPPASPAADEPGFVDAGNGYRLALIEGKLVCKNAQGKKLASVPKEVRDSEVGEQLLELRDWLVSHDKECKAQVEEWMLRSLPTPRRVVEAVWEDEAYRTALENAVVVPLDETGARRDESCGFLRAVDPAKGIGLVTLDGETVWVSADAIVIPHPVLIDDLQDFRSLAVELGFAQGIAQLLRETYGRPADLVKDATAVRDFVGGEFAQLNHALALCRRHGYRVSGGWAVTRVWEGGVSCEARYWIGSEDPTSPTWTDELQWVSEEERSLPLSAVGPVAYSEGLRMGTRIFAGRVLPKEESNA